MPTVNMLEAKSNLSRLVDAVESGAEKEVVIARNGRPAARLVPFRPASKGKRIGIAKGKFAVPDTLDAHDALIAKMFAGRRK